VNHRGSKRIVEAERFVLKDELGQERAVLEMGDKGPFFSLLTDQGHPRLILGAGDYGPFIQFFEPHTETMTELCAPHTAFEVSWIYRHRGIEAKVRAEVSSNGVTLYDGENRVLSRIQGKCFAAPEYLRDRE
jgi:hypothetical protein